MSVKVTLSKRWQGSMFRRSIRDKNDSIVEMLEFPKGEVVEIKTKEEQQAIANCIGGPLDCVNAKGRADAKLTEELVCEIAGEIIAAAEKANRAPVLTPYQQAAIARPQDAKLNEEETESVDKPEAKEKTESKKK